MPVEQMDRQRWWTLTDEERAEWQQRLSDQWKLADTEVAEMWIDGDRVVGVRQWLRGKDGRLTGAWKILGTENLP